MEWLTLPRIGLLFDITGALILVYSHLTSGRSAFAEADLFWGANVKMKAIATAKVDSVVGVALICVGFLGQLLGSDTSMANAFASSSVAVPAALALLVVLSLAYLVFRARLTVWYYKLVRGDAA